MDNKTLSEIIKNARIEKGISQRELSRQTGIDNNTIAKIENGSRKKPNALSLKKLAFVLNLELSELLVLSGYTKNDIDLILEKDLNEIVVLPNENRKNPMFLEDMLNNSKNSLLFKTSLKELLDKSDFSVLDSFKSKNKSEQKIILEELRKYKDNNNQEIKGLEEHIKNLEEMFNKD